MMTKRPIKHHMDGLLVLLLFGVFAACILSVLLMGADAYKSLTERDREAYDRRTAAQYIATKVRQADRLDAVSVENFQGVSALVLAEELEGETYLTRVYYCDGYLRELFSAESAELVPEDGEKLLEADGLLLVREENTLIVEILLDGDWQTLTLTLRSGEGAAA